MAKGKDSFNEMARGLFSNEANNEKEPIDRKSKTPTIKSTGYKLRQYYISEEQYKAIKRLAVERDTNASFIVRTAIDSYLESNN